MSKIMQEARKTHNLPIILAYRFRRKHMVFKGGVECPSSKMHDPYRVDVARVHRSRKRKLGEAHLKNISETLNEGVIEQG